MATLHKETCPTCRQSINEREITLFSDLVKALWKVAQWCEQRDRSTFTRKEVKHLFTNENQSARFGDLVLFGSLVRRTRKGAYLIDRAAVDAFFSGRLRVPSVVHKNPLTGSVTVKQSAYITEIRNLSDLLTNDGEFIARYRASQASLF
jgi:hypothetical protein